MGEVLSIVGFLSGLVSIAATAFIKVKQDKRLIEIQGDADRRINEHQLNLDKRLDSHQLTNDKRLATHQLGLDQRLSEFRIELERQNALDFESFKASLEVEVAENRWIREKRFLLVQELYSLLVEIRLSFDAIELIDADSSSTFLVGLLSTVQNDEAKLGAIVRLFTSLSNFRSVYLKNRIILSVPTCEIVDKVQGNLVKMNLPAINVMLKHFVPPKNQSLVDQLKEVTNNFDIATKTILEDFTRALAAFENEARSILPIEPTRDLTKS